jgi:hypothetical protein
MAEQDSKRKGKEEAGAGDKMYPQSQTPVTCFVQLAPPLKVSITPNIPLKYKSISD